MREQERQAEWVDVFVFFFSVMVLIISSFSSDGKKVVGLNWKVVLENWDIGFRLKGGLITLFDAGCPY